MKIEEAIKIFEDWAKCNYEPTKQAAQLALTALHSMPEAGESFHIDKSEWTAEWVPMTDDDGCVWFECSACEYDLDSLEELHPFCPSCGRAMTEEAWAELERRVMR